MPAALTIAGSDSSGGAGIQADLKTFAAFGVYGTSAITAITAQNTCGVSGLAPLPADLVTAQIETVAADLHIDATKIGMLATAAIVEAVAAAVADLDLPLVVVDPLMVSSSGVRLLDPDGVQALATHLLPRARVVTPNIPEAEVLSGCRVGSLSEGRRAAERIHGLGAAAVIVTGGHAGGSDVVDLLYDGVSFVELRTPRVSGPPAHGTGCAFASAVAAGLALGKPLRAAAEEAQHYVAGALAHALHPGRGASTLDFFWNLRVKSP